MKLYSYFRSSASYRVRIALQLKGLPYDYLPVHLVQGEQLQADYASAQGDALVPRLQTDDGALLSQSLAIIEYLEEAYPQSPRLLPSAPLARAQVRALAQMVACEIHPLNNLRVLRYLVHDMHSSEEAKTAWYQHWVRSGLQAFERQLALLAQERAQAGLAPSRYCWGDAPTLADCCLLPQLYNADRFGVPCADLPHILAVQAACQQLPAFARAHPSACPDAA
ncbi:maleylacetoacetate isomerase [Acidovorax sp. HDW3]|uniref:maleylacetoacetate isomerase n=1 Tax=Acidovorax sp. HDW3 TaxID=2714923 RepID=UPI00140D9FBA|nr:maleylacetoacetate isomerase [Acidovorax sp. HDW3]QIL43863.1 maleylacetoacetate isomerase [Acidovorax sp. HDW3]